MENNRNDLSYSIHENLSKLESSFKNCADLRINRVTLKDNTLAYFVYINDLTNLDLVMRNFITPILSMNYTDLQDQNKLFNIPTFNISTSKDITTIVTSILSGKTIMLIDKINYVISCELVDFESRSITEPVIEKNVRGPHEGFIEKITTNASILRRKVKNSSLKFIEFTIGNTTKQTVYVSYIEGLADQNLVNTVCSKISSININGLAAIGYIEQQITDFKYTFFPLYQTTERPDKASSSLLEGKLVILLDGTPVALIAPVNFFSFFQALDDYSANWLVGSMIRLIRYMALFIALFFPALYISVLTFHYYMIPLSMLLPLGTSRSTVPFSPIFEAFSMEIILEMLREASIRLPSYIGISAGIVGGIVIGEAAVRAGIVSNILIIVVAVTAIATFLIPNYDMGLAIRLVRFIFMISASLLGIFGVICCFCFLLIHLITLESLGEPYFQPLFPFKLKGIKDAIIRAPMKYFKKGN